MNFHRKPPALLQEAEVIALPRIIVKRWRDAGVDILVNNAGMGRNDASLFDGNTASWVEMVSTNTLGVCMCTREALQVCTHHTSKLSEHIVLSPPALHVSILHALRWGYIQSTLPSVFTITNVRRFLDTLFHLCKQHRCSAWLGSMCTAVVES